VNENTEELGADPELAVELDGIGRVYSAAASVIALHPTDLKIRKGDYVAITGPSGSGKSTLLNILGLLDQPTEGTYRLNGIDTAHLSDRDVSKLRGSHIGFVFQSFHLLPHRTAAENVMIAQLYNRSSRKNRRERAYSALERVGLAHRADALPTTLSGGEQQRVAVARALVNSPGLLLCDEPTGNLDSTASAGVLDLIESLYIGGYTVVVITHDPGVANRAERVVTIHDGRLTEPERRAAEPEAVLR
jgi:putative ABC transport system ATP-binding protein